MKRRGSFTFGLLLILLGAWFLLVQFVPDVGDWMEQFADWPIWIIGPGLIFILAGLISGVYDLMVPGSIISGIGLILYYQNETGDYQSWAYVWALIIVFVGIGVFLANLFRGKVGRAFEEGGPPMMTGLVLFLIFGSIFRATFGQSPLLGEYWPLLLVVVGLWLLVKPLLRGKTKTTKVVVNIQSGDDARIVEEEPVEEWEAKLDAEFDEMDAKGDQA
ncbi:MAG TPA: hypothetical protein DCY42_10025 [Chloroflexi bacterium]|nr:hypothetical protein [Chloroflexota bacterium]